MKILYSNTDKISHSKLTYQKQPSMSVLHNHNFFEFYYLLDGERSYFIDNAIYELSVGDAVIIPPNVLHRTLGAITKLHSRVLISIPREVLEKDFLEEYNELLQMYIFPIPKKRRQFFENLLEKIKYEVETNDSYSEYLLKKYINEMLIFLLRANKKNEIIYVDNEIDSSIGKAARYIQQNFSRTLTLEEIADVLNIDRTYFCKMFKKKTGFGFSEYIKEVRVMEAAKLLSETDLSITEVALSVGYNDSSYFAKVFKNIKGTTPLVFRKMMG